MSMKRLIEEIFARDKDVNPRDMRIKFFFISKLRRKSHAVQGFHGEIFARGKNSRPEK